MSSDTSNPSVQKRKKTFDQLRAKSLRRKKLFEDKEFAAEDSSIYKTKVVPTYVSWKRPKELCDDPQFIVGGTSRFDLNQGDLGNCWFVAAATTVASKPQLLNKVVPPDQNFHTDYAGIFHFYFWQYGRWEEVIIDDRLPVVYGRQLMFSKNTAQPNEFWCALMEKAYAKLYGSYEALKGGKIQDGLVDMTGGAGEVIDLTHPEKVPRKLYSFLMNLHEMNSLMGCAINAKEVSKLLNGLVCGHAYSITGMIRFKIGDKKQRLLRLRNPWGMMEWKGPWSDGSPEWDQLKPSEAESLNLKVEEDGEFWISYEDWRKNFTEVQICHLTPQSPILDTSRKQWCMAAMDGHWERGITAGGCGNPPNEDLYWSNPQCHIELRESSSGHHDDVGQCRLVVSLMHKFRRMLQMEGLAKDVIIGYDIYKVKDGLKHKKDTMLGLDDLELQRRMDISHNYREVCHTFAYPPGHYCIIPATFYPHQEAEFYLRVVSETEAQMERLDEPVHSVGSEEDLQAIFDRHAGKMGGADAKGLRNILRTVYKKDKVKFTVEHCTSYIIKFCGDGADTLDYDMFSILQQHLDDWKAAFDEKDQDKNGDITLRQLRKVIRTTGIGNIKNSKPVQDAIAEKYGGDGNHYTFAEVAHILCKLSSAKEAYEAEHGEVDNGSPLYVEYLVNALNSKGSE